MSAAFAAAEPACSPAVVVSGPACGPVVAVAAAPARVALLGTGTVGRAVLARLAGWSGTPLEGRLSLVHVANTRRTIADAAGLCPQRASVAFHSPLRGESARSAGEGEPGAGEFWHASATDGGDASSPPSPQPCPRPGASPLGVHERASQRLASAPAHPLEGEGAKSQTGCRDVATTLGHHGTRIVIDATASDPVAEQHAQWLAQGIHVVTACKLGQGTSLARWRAIHAAAAHGGTRYGDSATVGAGLPLLRSLRELQAGGDRIHAIAGVLSGSLAWLFNHYDGLRPFSAFVREARDAGYTEPDPRDDLSGEDVRRKLLILARAAGVALEACDIEVDSLVPPALASLSSGDVDAALPSLDAPLRERFAQAWKSGGKLRFIARLERDVNGTATARIGLETLAVDHPLAGGAGTDNRVAIWSDRYQQQPLVIQGPGAGAQVTAAGLLDDVLRIANCMQ